MPKAQPHPTNRLFDVYVFDDPAFKKPWVLATPVALSFESVHALYTDRWPVEQLPLSAKHMVGAHRQFVHHPESVQRLPELAVLAGRILSFLAATLPPTLDSPVIMASCILGSASGPYPGSLASLVAGLAISQRCSPAWATSPKALGHPPLTQRQRGPATSGGLISSHHTPKRNQEKSRATWVA